MGSSPTKPCSPPLKLVSNGSAGSPFPAPLDNSIIPPADSDPGFSDLANKYLGDSSTDASLWTDEITGALGTIDSLSSVDSTADADLDAILFLLDIALNTDIDTPTNQYSDAFAGENALPDAISALSPAPLPPLPTTWVPTGATSLNPPAGYPAQVPGQITEGDPPFTYQFTGNVTVSTGFVAGETATVSVERMDAAFSNFQVLSQVGAHYIPPPAGHGTNSYQQINVNMSVDINPATAGVYLLVVVSNAHGLPAPVVGTLTLVVNPPVAAGS